MNNEKQIEEMAEYIFGNAITHDTRFKEDCRSIAIDLYTAGYRKQSEGEWIDQYQGKYVDQLYKCSVCGDTAFHDDKRWFLTPYCPNCGAKMKGGAE